jgi:hypothetical protein
MKTSVLKRLSESLDQHYQASYSKAYYAVLMGEDDYRDLREEVKGLTMYSPFTTTALTVMEAEVHSDLRIGNRGWIIGSKTEIEKMRKQLMEAQFGGHYQVPDWIKRPYNIDFWALSEQLTWSLKKPDYPFAPRSTGGSTVKPDPKKQEAPVEYVKFLRESLAMYAEQASRTTGSVQKESDELAAWYADKLAKL